MKYDSLLIQKPQAQPPLQRTVFGVITAMFWAIYVYLWMPLLTLLLWLLGLRTAVFELYLRENRVEPFVLLALPVLAVLCTLLLLVWAAYNRQRFSGHDRRHPQPQVRPSEIAVALGASRKTAVLLSTCKTAVLHMDEAARPATVSLIAPTEQTQPPSAARVQTFR